jgi:hypothetical protein
LQTAFAVYLAGFLPAAAGLLLLTRRQPVYWQVRVPLERYRENVSAIGAGFAKRHVAVVLITAPTSRGSS